MTDTPTYHIKNAAIDTRSQVYVPAKHMMLANGDRMVEFIDFISKSGVPLDGNIVPALLDLMDDVIAIDKEQTIDKFAVSSQKKVIARTEAFDRAYELLTALKNDGYSAGFSAQASSMVASIAESITDPDPVIYRDSSKLLISTSKMLEIGVPASSDTLRYALEQAQAITEAEGYDVESEMVEDAISAIERNGFSADIVSKEAEKLGRYAQNEERSMQYVKQRYDLPYSLDNEPFNYRSEILK